MVSDLLRYCNIVHLEYMSGHRSCSRELSVAVLASKMTILLMLKQDVGIYELLVTVVAEWLQHCDSSLFLSHL